jgi:hypothetical protein
LAIKNGEQNMTAFFHGGDLDRILLWGFILLFLFTFGAIAFGLIYGTARLAEAWGERYEVKSSEDESQEETKVS